MADAEDLKSFTLYRVWGFDSPSGHHIFCECKHLGAPLKSRCPEVLRETCLTFA